MQERVSIRVPIRLSFGKAGIYGAGVQSNNGAFPQVSRTRIEV